MLESPLRVLGRLPRSVRVLVVGTLVNRAGAFIVPFLSLVLSRELGLPAGTAGLLIAGFGAGSVVSILAGGALTDRLGRRATLLLSLLGGGAIALAMGLVPEPRAFAPLLIAFGFLSEMYRIPSSAIVADELPSEQRAVGFAALRMATNLGFACGMGIGGVVAEWSWRLLFVGDGLTTLAFGLVVFFLIPETRREPAGAAERDRRGPSPFRDRRFLEMLAAGLLFAVVFFADVTVLPLTITLGAGYPAWVYGLLVGTNGLVIALVEVSAVAALADFRRLRVAALGALVTGLGFALNGFADHWSGFLAGVLVWTAGEILSVPQQMAFVADWAPPEARGRYLAAYTALWSMAWAINPVTLLPLHAQLGDSRFWPLLALVMTPVALLLIHLDRSADRPELLRGRVALG